MTAQLDTPAPSLGAAYALRCRECGATTDLDASYACMECFGPLEVAYAQPAVTRADIEAGPVSMWRYEALLPVVPGAGSRPGLQPGFTRLVRADNLAAALGARVVWVKDDSGNPTHSFKDRVVAVALENGRRLGYTTIACASTGNLANAVAAAAARAGLKSVVFVPSNLEAGKIVTTAVYGGTLVAIDGNYDDVNRLCSEIASNRDWGFVNVNLRPYYAEGSKTVGYRGRRAARLAAAGRRGVAGGLRLAADQGRQGLPGVRRPRAGRGSCLPGVRCAGDWMLARRAGVQVGPRRHPPREAGHDREVARDRQPRRRALRARCRPPDRGAIADVSDEEVVDGIKLLARTEGIFAETAGGVVVATYRKLLAEGLIDP